LFGEFTVDETIAVEKEITAHGLAPSDPNTLWKIVQVAVWLSIRLSVSKEEITAQLYKSMPLVEALWVVFALEREGITENYELDEPVTEGKETDNTVPLKTSRKSGTRSTSSSHQVALLQNSEMDLDSNE
jgi:hypothetical protein